MDPSDFAAVGSRMLFIGLATYGIVRSFVKPVVRRSIRKEGRLSGARMTQYKDSTRSAAILVGALLALLPGIWPEGVPRAWAAIYGVVSGSFSIALHHAAKRLLPDVLSRLLLGRGISAGMAADESGEWSPQD